MQAKNQLVCVFICHVYFGLLKSVIVVPEVTRERVGKYHQKGGKGARERKREDEKEDTELARICASSLNCSTHPSFFFSVFLVSNSLGLDFILPFLCFAFSFF